MAGKTKTVRAVRPLYAIAREVREDWRPVHPSARPYVGAMECLTSVRDSFGWDDGADVVLRFLGNARTWKGDTARRVKAELRDALAGAPVEVDA